MPHGQCAQPLIVFALGVRQLTFHNSAFGWGLTSIEVGDCGSSIQGIGVLRGGCDAKVLGDASDGSVAGVLAEGCPKCAVEVSQWDCSEIAAWVGGNCLDHILLILSQDAIGDGVGWAGTICKHALNCDRDPVDAD